LGGAYEGAAEKAAKNDPWKRLKAIWDQLYEALGQALLPVIEELGKWFANPKNRENVQKFIQKVSDLAQQFGEDLVDAIKDAMKWLKDPKNQEKLDEWAKAFGDLARQIQSTVGWIQSVIDWLGKIPKLPDWMTRDQGGGGWGFGAQGNAAPAASTRAAPTATAGNAPMDMNIVVNVDQWGSARVTKRALEANDRRQGRQPGTPLRVAW
jgi:hypothetical protein